MLIYLSIHLHSLHDADRIQDCLPGGGLPKADSRFRNQAFRGLDLGVGSLLAEDHPLGALQSRGLALFRVIRCESSRDA